MSFLEGQTAFITGGSRGIGKAIALHLAQAGAKIAICARREPYLEEAARELQSLTPDYLALPLDIRRASDVKSAVERIETTLGPIGILINNAGIYRKGTVWEMDVDDWDAQFEINLKGHFLVTQAVVPGMIARRWGRILFLSTVSALFSFPGISCYTAVKRGLEGFAGCLGQELCGHGIKVHVLRPGFTETAIFEETGKPDLDIDWFQPREIAEAVEFLLRLPEHAQVPELTYMTTFDRSQY
ncbi:MAG: SDR family oxidoreductase [Candidatus Omnitrophica bacterium]|nr:SDR family oxidoreductase [Candidatus Omnitrophota bacterium]